MIACVIGALAALLAGAGIVIAVLLRRCAVLRRDVRCLGRVLAELAEKMPPGARRLAWWMAAGSSKRRKCPAPLSPVRGASRVRARPCPERQKMLTCVTPARRARRAQPRSPHPCD